MAKNSSTSGVSPETHAANRAMAKARKRRPATVRPDGKKNRLEGNLQQFKQNPSLLQQIKRDRWIAAVNDEAARKIIAQVQKGAMLTLGDETPSAVTNTVCRLIRQGGTNVRFNVLSNGNIIVARPKAA